MNPTNNHPAAPRVAVREQLLALMKEQPAVQSTGAQTFLYLTTPNAQTCYAVPLTSPHLRSWLTVRHIHDGSPAPSDAHIRQAVRVKEDECIGGTTRNVRCQMNLRYASDAKNPELVLSLDTPRGRHVSVTPGGWAIKSTHSSFVFDPLQQIVPDPIPPAADPHTALQPFRQLLRLEDPRHNETWQSLLHWTLAAMRAPKDAAFHDYPILNLMGPAACGKSVTAKLLTQLLDPTLTPIHSLPSTERRLHGLAASHHILTFDDPGKINPEKSRYLSRLASGVTSLHPRLEGMLVRPIILTTTGESETKHLTNKVVDIELPAIEAPQPQEQIQNQFNQLRPQILGALLTLQMDSFEQTPPNLPNRKTKIQKIEKCVTDFLTEAGGSWQGTATELATLCAFSLSTKALSAALDEMTNLRVTRPQRKNSERPIHIELPL